MFGRRRLLCCDKERFLVNSCKAVVVVDIIWFALWILVYSTIIKDPSDNTTYFKNSEGNLTRAQVKIISLNYVYIGSSLALALLVKMYFGVEWWRKKQTRNLFAKYYTVSWTYYTSFFITQVLFLITAQKNLSQLSIVALSLLIVWCFPGWWVLYMYMDFRDTQHFSIKNMLQQTFKEMLKKEQRRKTDEQLVARSKAASYHYSASSRSNKNTITSPRTEQRKLGVAVSECVSILLKTNNLIFFYNILDLRLRAIKPLQ